MKLAIYHEPVHKEGNQYDTYGPYARYVLEFARHFDHVRVFAPATERPTYFSGCPLSAPNVSVVALPFFMTHVQAYKQARKIATLFRQHCSGLDIINCRGTAPLAYLLWWMTRRTRPLFVYHFASDPFELLQRGARYRGLYGQFARCAYSVEFAIQKFIVARNYAFASGSAIYARLRRHTSNVDVVIDSTICADDLRPRGDCCLGRPVRILYVGYLRQNKGLEDLVEAIAILQSLGRDVVLDLVGDGELRPSLVRRAQAAGVASRVRFHGYARMGPELNAFYNAADIFVLPSLSEGSPRVILEAMAHGVPVVATGVGNVPELLAQGRRGLLVPPWSPGAIARAVSLLMDAPALRRSFLKEGFEFASARSVEAFVGAMAQRMRELVQERRREQF